MFSILRNMFSLPDAFIQVNTRKKTQKFVKIDYY